MTSLYRWLNERHSQKVLRHLGQAVARSESKTTKTTHTKWTQWLADRALREQIRQSRPWWLKSYDRAHVFLFGWNGLINHKMNPRNMLNWCVWKHQRATRGWSDRDTWSMDSHLAKIMGEMLLHMADHSHAYPGYGAFDTPEKWDAHLRDMSRRLLAWNDDTWCDNDAFETTKQAMIEFGQNYGFYWDLWIMNIH